MSYSPPKVAECPIFLRNAPGSHRGRVPAPALEDSSTDSPLVLRLMATSHFRDHDRLPQTLLAPLILGTSTITRRSRAYGLSWISRKYKVYVQISCQIIPSALTRETPCHSHLSTGWCARHRLHVCPSLSLVLTPFLSTSY